MVQRACGVTTVHRFVTAAVGVTGPNNNTVTLPLLTAADAPDPEVGGDFATACQALQDSRVTHIDLSWVLTSSADHGLISWCLLMNKDGQYAVTPVELWDNSPTQDAREARKYIPGAGSFVHLGTETRTKINRIRVSRKALARMGLLGEDTTFDLLIQSQAAQTSVVRAWGRIYTKKF